MHLAFGPCTVITSSSPVHEISSYRNLNHADQYSQIFPEPILLVLFNLMLKSTQHQGIFGSSTLTAEGITALCFHMKHVFCEYEIPCLYSILLKVEDIYLLVEFITSCPYGNQRWFEGTQRIARGEELRQPMSLCTHLLLSHFLFSLISLFFSLYFHSSPSFLTALK